MSKDRNKQSKQEYRSDENIIEELIAAKIRLIEKIGTTLKVSVRLALVLAALSITALYVTLLYEADEKFFAVDEAGQYIQLYPLSQPNNKPQVITQWLSDALVDTFDFHYLNINDSINVAAMQWFTPEGRESLVGALDKSNLFVTTRRDKFIVQLTLKRTPILVREGLNKTTGVYEWVLQVDGKFTYTNEEKVFVNDVIFTVVVVRRSMLEDIKGLGISKIFADIKRQ